jgi:hypothetical protein
MMDEAVELLKLLAPHPEHLWSMALLFFGLPLLLAVPGLFTVLRRGGKFTFWKLSMEIPTPPIPLSPSRPVKGLTREDYEKAGLGKVPDRVVALRLKMSRSGVVNARRRFGIAPFSGRPLLAVQEQRPRRNFSAER